MSERHTTECQPQEVAGIHPRNLTPKTMLGMKFTAVRAAIIGFLVGYFVVHPITMFMTNLVHYHIENGEIHLHDVSEAVSVLKS